MSGAVQPALFNLDGWCQRWNRGAATWQPADEDAGRFVPARYRVVPIGEVDARRFVVGHHYSGSYPAAALRLGLLHGGTLVGVAVLGVPMSRQVLTGVFPTLEPYRQALELSRLVLLDPVPCPAESWFVARVFRHAAEHGVRGVVAFSDPMPRQVGGQVLMPGHVGTAYKALNARYTGRGTPRTLTMLPDGRVLSARARAKVTGGERGAAGVVRRLVDLGAPAPTGLAAMTAPERGVWLAEALGTAGARTVRHRGNHRYVWTVGDRSARRRTPVALDAQPYPTAADPAR